MIPYLNIQKASFETKNSLQLTYFYVEGEDKRNTKMYHDAYFPQISLEPLHRLKMCMWGHIIAIIRPLCFRECFTETSSVLQTRIRPGIMKWDSQVRLCLHGSQEIVDMKVLLLQSTLSQWWGPNGAVVVVHLLDSETKGDAIRSR